MSTIRAVDDGDLRGKLYKRHRKPSFGGGSLGVRFFEVDDSLGGALLCFKTAEDLHRRLPHHCYALGDSCVRCHRTQGRLTGRLSNGISYITAHAFSLELHGESAPLILGCESEGELDRWTQGLQQRITRYPASRTITVLLSGYRGTDQIGIAKVSNLESSAIGVLIQHVDPESASAKAGVQAGDILVAVDGSACLSYKHAEKLLEEAGSSRWSSDVYLLIA